MKNTFFLFILFSARTGSAQPVVVSSAAPADVEASSATVPSKAGADQGRVILNISKNSSYSRVGLDYSVRWDFSDLASFRPGLGAIVSRVRAISSWDITENTRVNYYGFKANPWLVILGPERNRPAAGGTAASGQTTSSLLSSAAPHKRLRLSVSPLVEDFERNFERNMQEFLLTNSLKSVSPAWQKAGEQGRREFLQDVLSLGGWDSSLPVQKSKNAPVSISSKPVTVPDPDPK